jgi:hypothetical protein
MILGEFKGFQGFSVSLEGYGMGDFQWDQPSGGRSVSSGGTPETSSVAILQTLRSPTKWGVQGCGFEEYKPKTITEICH